MHLFVPGLQQKTPLPISVLHRALRTPTLPLDIVGILSGTTALFAREWLAPTLLDMLAARAIIRIFGILMSHKVAIAIKYPYYISASIGEFFIPAHRGC